MTTKHTLLLLSLMMIGTGCRDDSARVAQVAERALTQQAEQNAEMARLNRDVTETTQQLVEADAKARQDVLAAQRDIQTQQNGVNQQRDSLEQERRDIVARRHRDPLIAQAIGAVGLTFACLLPLLLAAYIIRTVNRDSDDGSALSEMLIVEMTAEQPLLLPVSPRPVAALEHAPSHEGDETAATAASSTD